MTIRNLVIRDAVESDLPAIVAIFNEAVANGYSTAQTTPVTVESRIPWFRSHSPKRPFWVAEVDGKVAAWFSFQDFHDRSGYHITAEVSVYLTAAHQGHGLGKRLLEQAIAGAPKLGLRNLVALVQAHNEHSVKLFTRAGFAEWGRLPKVAEMNGIERDLVIFGRRVP